MQYEPDIQRYVIGLIPELKEISEDIRMKIVPRDAGKVGNEQPADARLAHAQLYA